MVKRSCSDVPQGRRFPSVGGMAIALLCGTAAVPASAASSDTGPLRTEFCSVDPIVLQSVDVSAEGSRMLGLTPAAGCTRAATPSGSSAAPGDNLTPVHMIALAIEHQTVRIMSWI